METERFRGNGPNCKIPTIDLFHNGGQIKYSVLMLRSFSSLATASKFQKNICFKMRAVSLININTKECKGWPQFMKVLHIINNLRRTTQRFNRPYSYSQY